MPCGWVLPGIPFLRRKASEVPGEAPSGATIVRPCVNAVAAEVGCDRGSVPGGRVAAGHVSDSVVDVDMVSHGETVLATVGWGRHRSGARILLVFSSVALQFLDPAHDEAFFVQ